jgi:N-acetylglucosamine-6-phosphate deacetylase
MATTQPAKLLGIKSYGLNVGATANLVLFRWDGKMRVTHTMLDGKLVFQEKVRDEG